MVYDSNARKLGIKAIGTVESNLTYDAINYNDPITVGVAQWYGVRAAAILVRMRDENAAAWTGVASSLVNALNSNPASSTWWNSRYLTRTEGNSLKPVLLANQVIQNNQFGSDIDGYMQTATRISMDIENNTLAALFFASMYHQSPVRAQRIVAQTGPSSSLARLHSAALNEPILGQYRTRLNTVRAILEAGDTSGVDDPHDPTPEPGEGGDSGGNNRLQGEFSYIRVTGNSLTAHKKTGGVVNFVRATPKTFIAGLDANSGSEVVPEEPNPDPSVPPSSDIASKRAAIRAFMVSIQNTLEYSQGPRRLDPENSGYSDCSATLHYAFKKVLGITLGTWSGAQKNDGVFVARGTGAPPLSQMAVGDIVWFPGHVEMYAGNDENIGHGGYNRGAPHYTKGPYLQNCTAQCIRRGQWEVRRVIL